jgi:hypothetical protein
VCLLGAVNVGAWNSINLVSTELYKTVNRSTAYGFMAALGRIGAVAGNLSFALLINVSAAYPFMCAALAFVTAAGAAILLPETLNKSLQ